MREKRKVLRTIDEIFFFKKKKKENYASVSTFLSWTFAKMGCSALSSARGLLEIFATSPLMSAGA